MAVLPTRIATTMLPLATLIAGAAGAAPAAAATLHTGRGCYLVGQRVTLRGAGFGASREYIVSIDGVYFGSNTTDVRGSFTSALRPGGLGAGIPEAVDQLEASDGTVTADTTFTLTRPAGARFLATSGNPRTLRSRFQAWGFGTDGRHPSVYLHYVSPSGRLSSTVSLGRAGGQCGYLETGSRRVFPFAPSRGHWTLQVDTQRAYHHRPAGAVARIGVQIA